MKKSLWRLHLAYLVALYAAAFIYLLYAYNTMISGNTNEQPAKNSSHPAIQATDTMARAAPPAIFEMIAPLSFHYAGHYALATGQLH